MKNLFPLLFGNDTAYAQTIINCPDGTRAEESIGCVSAPSNLVSTEANLSEIILKIADGLLGFVMAVAIIFLIYGGVKYSIASGDDDKIQKAKRTMVWSVIGLSVAFLARLGVEFLLNNLY